MVSLCLEFVLAKKNRDFTSPSWSLVIRNPMGDFAITTLCVLFNYGMSPVEQYLDLSHLGLNLETSPPTSTIETPHWTEISDSGSSEIQP